MEILEAALILWILESGDNQVTSEHLIKLNDWLLIREKDNIKQVQVQLIPEGQKGAGLPSYLEAEYKSIWNRYLVKEGSRSWSICYSVPKKQKQIAAQNYSEVVAKGGGKGKEKVNAFVRFVIDRVYKKKDAGTLTSFVRMQRELMAIRATTNKKSKKPSSSEEKAAKPADAAAMEPYAMKPAATKPQR
jgi:hypothetical protein